jgi:hypothetical protein
MLVPIGLILFLIVLRFNLVAKLIRRLRLFFELRGKSATRNNPQLASRLYLEMLHVLKKAGFAREETQTPNEFAAKLKETGLARTVHEFTRLYSAARFGGVTCDTGRLQELLGQIRSAVRGQ